MELGGVIQNTTSAYHAWLLRVLYKEKNHSNTLQESKRVECRASRIQVLLGMGLELRNIGIPPIVSTKRI